MEPIALNEKEDYTKRGSARWLPEEVRQEVDWLMLHDYIPFMFELRTVYT